MGKQQASRIQNSLMQTSIPGQMKLITIQDACDPFRSTIFTYSIQSYGRNMINRSFRMFIIVTWDQSKCCTFSDSLLSPFNDQTPLLIVLANWQCHISHSNIHQSRFLLATLCVCVCAFCFNHIISCCLLFFCVDCTINRC